MDWLVDPERPDAGDALRSWLHARAQEPGCERLQLLLPDFGHDFLAFQEAGFRVEPTRSVLMARCKSRRHGALWLHQNWYVTFADFGVGS